MIPFSDLSPTGGTRNILEYFTAQAFNDQPVPTAHQKSGGHFDFGRQFCPIGLSGKGVTPPEKETEFDLEALLDGFPMGGYGKTLAKGSRVRRISSNRVGQEIRRAFVTSLGQAWAALKAW